MILWFFQNDLIHPHQISRNIIKQIDQRRLIIVTVKVILPNGMSQIIIRVIKINVAAAALLILNVMHIIHIGMVHVKKKSGMKMNGVDHGNKTTHLKAVNENVLQFFFF